MKRQENIWQKVQRAATTSRPLHLMLVLAAMMAAACSSGDASLAEENSPAAAPATVAFDAYLQRSTTRSGAQGTLTTSTDGTVKLQDAGFGVLGFYTGAYPYDALRFHPDFMYNDHVTWDGARWRYEPVKYWPNGEGEVTPAVATPTAGVTGAAAHYVSFFAYAPWIDVDYATGLPADRGTGTYSATEGITALTRNTHTGDPMVRYDVVFDPARRVDLCWASPRLNLSKPQSLTPTTVDFQFRHALTALNIQVDANIAQTLNDGNLQSDYTRIWIRSVSIEGIATKGWLNLNRESAEPQWFSIDGYSTLSLKPVTIHDGRRDTREAILADSNENPIGLNSNIIQTTPYTIEGGVITAPTITGVSKTTVNLFGDDSDGTLRSQPIFAIPTGGPLRVTVVYDVETYDAKLVSNQLSDGRTPGSTIENNITATVTLAGTPIQLEAGKSYALRLHLGLRSVEAEAIVTNGWITGAVDEFDNDDYKYDDPTTLGVSIINNYNQGATVDDDVVLP